MWSVDDTNTLESLEVGGSVPNSFAHSLYVFQSGVDYGRAKRAARNAPPPTTTSSAPTNSPTPPVASPSGGGSMPTTSGGLAGTTSDGGSLATLAQLFSQAFGAGASGGSGAYVGPTLAGPVDMTSADAPSAGGGSPMRMVIVLALVAGITFLVYKFVKRKRG